ncbi:MAG TPA: DNA cytosine methyltransferase [Thermoanaerobaculia bacterium]|nr:DNA cytosine methyltransferase [Thermoanaerobaculia bacterium]
MVQAPVPARLRALELFAGIGGFAAALGGDAEVVAALDIHRGALAVYRENFPHPVRAVTLESLPVAQLAAYRADLWWLSPPCQPFTTRGLGKDLEDPRSRALFHLIPVLGELRPRLVALENVPGFVGSRARARLLATLETAGYEWAEHLLCPSELGVPNRRQRYYLAAALGGGLRPLEKVPAEFRPTEFRPLLAYLDAEPEADLWIDPELARRYQGALDVVHADDPLARTACFTAAYGHSPVRSGSYLATPTGLRRFSPQEVLRLLGFPESYRLPPDLPRQAAWRLAGNSLSVPAVRAVLGTLPGLG